MNAAESWTVLVCPELTRTQIMQFAGASGEFGELHVDEPAARALGHPSVLAHGMFCSALAARAITDRFGRRALRTFEVRYTAPAWPGDALSAACTVTAQDGPDLLVDVRLTNDVGAQVLTATARVRLDGPGGG